MFTFAPARRASRTPARLSTRSDWSALLAQARQQAQVNASVEQEFDALDAEVSQFVAHVQAQKAALATRIANLRGPAQSADEAFLELEDSYWEDGVPDEYQAILNEMPSGFYELLDDVESKLDELG